MTEQWRCVLVCQHRSCLCRGSEGILQALIQAELNQAELHNVAIIASPCLGQCSSGPMVVIKPDGIWYCRVAEEDVPRLIEDHLQADRPVVELLHPRFHGQLIATSTMVSATLDAIG